MTERTSELVNAVIGLERRGGFPVDDPFKWSEYAPERRYRWAALAALEQGDVAVAGVFSQLAMAVSVEDIGLELFTSRDET